MKKSIFLLLAFLFSIPAISLASVIQLPDGAYSMPAGWEEIAYEDNWITFKYDTDNDGITDDNQNNLYGPRYYLWTVDDATLGHVPTAIDIVFHHIQEIDNISNDKLSVYIKDVSNTPAGFSNFGYADKGSYLEGYINVTGEGTYWQDPAADNTYFDVVFHIEDQAITNLFANGNQYQLLIDPECLYDVEEITVAAAVPIPASVLLLGSGMFGLLMFRGRRKA